MAGSLSPSRGFTPVGAAMHALVSIGWAGGYAYVAAVNPLADRRWILSGLVYGLIVYTIMQTFCWPTTISPIRRRPNAFLNALVAHAALFRTSGRLRCSSRWAARSRDRRDSRLPAALRHNAQVLRNLVGPKHAAFVVKSNAYGHGFVETALAVDRLLRVCIYAIEEGSRCGKAASRRRSSCSDR